MPAKTSTFQPAFSQADLKYAALGAAEPALM